MAVQIIKHFDYLTPFEEAENDQELAKITRLKYPKACSNLERDAAFFASMVEGVRQFEAWRLIGFDTFEAFCQQKLGRTLQEVDAIVAGVRALQERGVAKPTAAEAIAAAPADKADKAGRPAANRSNPTISARDTSYLAARLKRDHPEIVARVEAGEFRSIHAAAVAAKIVRPRVSIPVDTPEAAIGALLRRFTREELQAALDGAA